MWVEIRRHRTVEQSYKSFLHGRLRHTQQSPVKAKFLLKEKGESGKGSLLLRINQLLCCTKNKLKTEGKMQEHSRADETIYAKNFGRP